MKKLIALFVLLILSIGWVVYRATPVDLTPSAVTQEQEGAKVADLEPMGDGSELGAVAAPAGAEVGSRDAGQIEGAPEPTAKMATILVDVHDSSGAPVAGRTIVLKEPSWATTGAPALFRRTSPAGRVAFNGLEAAQYVAADGFGPKSKEIYVEAGETKHLAWTIDADVTVRGQVVDDLGRPVAGAEVWCASDEDSSSPMMSAARTDASGRFTLRCAPGAALQVTAHGRIPSPAQFVRRLSEVEPGVREARFSLHRPGTPFGGRVIDSHGEPIGGASIVVRPGTWASYGDSPDALPRPIRAQTDPSGRFEYGSGLPAGAHRATVRAKGFAGTVNNVFIDNQPVEIELVLHRGATVSGSVTRPDGTPAPKAHVWIDEAGSKWQTYGSGYGPSTESDDDGNFVLRGVPLGRHSIRAQSGWAGPLARTADIVETAGDSLSGVDLLLDFGRTISGRIVDFEGAPVEGSVVTAFGDGVQSNDVASGPDGTFRIAALPEVDGGPDEWHVLVRTWTGTNVRVIAERHRVVPNSGEIELVLERTEEASGTIQGRIASISGPLPGDLQAILGEQDSTSGTPLTLDPDTGAFSKGPLRPGTYRIRIFRAGTPVVTKSGLVLGPDETIDAGVIRLEDGGSVEVRPNAPSSPPMDPDRLDAILRGAEANLLGPWGNSVPLMWNQGAWRHEGSLEAGDWRVSIQAEELFFPITSVRVEAGSSEQVNAVAEGGRTLQLRVQLPHDRDAWSSVQIELRDGAGKTLFESSAIPRDQLPTPDVTSLRRTLPPGTIRILVTTDTDIGADETVQVVPGSSSPQTLQVTAH